MSPAHGGLKGDDMTPPQRGDDIMTTFLGGTIALIVIVTVVVMFASFLFG